MKIHSDILTIADINDAVPSGCYLATFTREGTSDQVYIDCVNSRKRERGFIIRLSGSNKCAMRNLPDKAATYDEWGFFIAALFSKDENAIIGHYRDASHFDLLTEHSFPLVAA